MILHTNVNEENREIYAYRFLLCYVSYKNKNLRPLQYSAVYKLQLVCL
jgi:hypothetical protein